MIHSCTIQRSTPSQNDLGEPIDDWHDVAYGVNCRYVVREEKFADERQGLQMMTVTRLLLPAGTDVTAADRIKNIVIEDGQILPGPYGIEEALPRRGPKGKNHVSLKLEAIG